MVVDASASKGEEGVGPESHKSYLQKHGYAWGLLVPILLFFIVFNAIPLLWMIGLSFYRYVLTSGMAPVSVGL